MKIAVEYVSDGGYQIKVSSDEPQDFRDAIAHLKGLIPAAHRAWMPAQKAWHVDLDGQDYAREWFSFCRSMFNAEIVWTTPKKEARAWPPPKAEVDPFAVLHLLPSAPVEVVKAAHRALSLMNHPDLGGDVRVMQDINSAYDAINKRLAA